MKDRGELCSRARYVEGGRLVGLLEEIWAIFYTSPQEYERMGVFVQFFVWPASDVKSGEVTREELDSVPLALKCWVTWPFYFSVIYVAAVLSWYVWRQW